MMDQQPQHRKSHHSTSVLIFASCCINILLSLALLAVGFWLAFRHHINCLKFLEIPIIFIGVVLLVSTIVAIVGIKRQRETLVWIYLVLLFFLILLLLAFTLFNFFVTSGGGGHQVLATSFQEYKLNDYSEWLQNKVRDPNKWLDLRACLKDGQFCKVLNKQYSSLSKFDNANLSPIQSGCCKPPTACGFTFVKPTQWVSATNGGASIDCGIWDKNGLCYNCDSCRAGLLENVRDSWRKAAKVCLAILILLTLSYLISWAAFLRGHSYGYYTNNPGHGFSKPPYSDNGHLHSNT